MAFADAHELGEEIGAAEIAREADLGEGGGDLRAARSDAEVAGERDREAGAGRGARDDGDGDLRHVVQPARDFHAAAQVVGGFFGRAAMVGAALGGGKALHVAARAEGAAGAGDDDCADRAGQLRGAAELPAGRRAWRCERALRASGRFMVRMATPSCFVSRRSAMALLPCVFSSGIELRVGRRKIAPRNGLCGRASRFLMAAWGGKGHERHTDEQTGGAAVAGSANEEAWLHRLAEQGGPGLAIAFFSALAAALSAAVALIQMLMLINERSTPYRTVVHT